MEDSTEGKGSQERRETPSAGSGGGSAPVPEGDAARPEQPKPGPKASAKKKDEIGPRFLVSASPHLHRGQTTGGIMRLVVYALLPATALSIYFFGLAAAKVIVLSTGSAVLFEFLSRKIMKRPATVGDWSAVLTGLLLALNLPATSPWWLVLVGSFFAIVIAKQLYGGLGYNPFNPALVGRVVLLISFPVQMTARWVKPSAWGVDAVTSATPLTQAREALSTLGTIDVELSRGMVIDLLIGNRAGCLGEVSVVLLLLGGLFLIAKRVISWHVPVSFLATVWVLTGVFHLVDPSKYADPSFHVLTGGLWIGALFMATDYVTSPITGGGMLVYGFGCGLITVMIRLFGGYPEGVSFAILLMNAATPLIDRWMKPVVFGAEKRRAAA